MKIDLRGELAVITGGGSGIGLGIAQALVSCGSKVAILGRDSQKLEQASHQLGDQARGFVLDVNETTRHAKVLSSITDTFDHPISILVNNAGNHLKKPLLETSDDAFAEVMQTHVASSFALSRNVIEHSMKPNKKGTILFISSMAAFLAIPNIVAYTTAKAAIGGLVRSLMAESALYGIRINAIAPGWIDTDMMRAAVNEDESRKQRIVQRIPAGKFGMVNDIGNTAAFLCSPFASYINGVTLPVDGGALNSF